MIIRFRRTKLQVIVLLFLVFQIKQINNIENGIDSIYKIKEKNCDSNNYKCKLNLTFEGQISFNNSQIRKELQGEHEYISENELNIKIQDKFKENYELKNEEPYLIDKRVQNIKSDLNYVIEYNENYYGLDIRNKEGGLILRINEQLIFSEYYLKMSIETRKDFKMYGLGERFDSLEIKFEKNYRMWSFDQPQNGDHLDTEINTYGNQPVILMTNSNRTQHQLLLLRTSSAVNVIVIAGNDTNRLDFSLIGGIIDIKVFMHSDIKELIKMYRQFIGSHAVPAFWQLGHHHCRWGYRNFDHLSSIFKNYNDSHIPIDTFWLDIDYLDDYKIFTNNEDFSKEKMQELLGKYNKKFIPIIDPTISVKVKRRNGQEFRGLIDGLKKKVFLKDQSGYFMLSKQWAGPVFVPDFTHPNASDYWQGLLQDFKREYLFDGIWIDMNEVSNFVRGNYNISAEINGLQSELDQQLYLKERLTFPFLPMDKCLSEKTLDVFLKHFDNTLELYNHNLFNLHQQYQTYLSLIKLNQSLPFVLSRSNTLNSHKYSFHWTGDNDSNYVSLKNSLQEIFRGVLNGIQMIGADICGFSSNTNEPLCCRWYQVGSLYPFSRNHNAIYNIDQDPVSLGKLTTHTAYINLHLRYSLLRYYYLHLLINQQKSQLISPLFIFYNDPLILEYNNITEDQFLIGDSLMTAPILYQNTFSRQLYCPQNMFDFHNGIYYQSNLIHVIYNYLNDLVPLFIFQGKIVQVQNTQGVQSTQDLNNKIILKIAFDEINYSEGQLLMVADLQNEENIIKYCINYDCVITVTAHLFDKNHIEINLIINESQQQLYQLLIQNQDFIQIDKLHIYSSFSLINQNQSFNVCISLNSKDPSCQILQYTVFQKILITNQINQIQLKSSIKKKLIKQ